MNRNAVISSRDLAINPFLLRRELKHEVHKDTVGRTRFVAGSGYAVDGEGCRGTGGIAR